MEGRMSREEILKSASGTPTVTGTERYSPKPPSRAGYYSRSRGSHRSSYSGARKSSGRRYEKNDILPEGMDLFIVQLLASGVLLLIVMFVAVFHTEETSAVAKKLDESFSKNTTLDELKSGLFTARDKLSGGVGSVLEIFGGEIDESVDKPDGEGSLAEMTNSPEQSNTHTTQDGEGVSIDSETLKQIYESTEDFPKN